MAHRMASGSLLKLLAGREASGGFEGLRRRELCRIMDTRRITLSHIMDKEGTIARGHVVLGFSGCGHYVISYCCEVSLVPPTTFYRYSLHWWTFDLYKKLRQVASCDLFRDEAIDCELHLIVCQSIDQRHVIVLGCRGSRDKDDEQRACYVSILLCPLQPPGTTPTLNHALSIHFKFDILSPFPSFVPTLSLKIPGTLLLNTVDSLVAVSYQFPAEHSMAMGLRSSGHVASAIVSQSLGPRSPSLLAPNHNSPPTRGMDLALSPGHILQVDVYRDATLLPLVAGPAHHLSDDSGGVSVDQSVLDVELWLNCILQVQLEKNRLHYRSLMDYDIQLYQVDAEDYRVKFVIVVLLEAAKSPTSGVCSYTAEVFGVWSIAESRAILMHMSELEPALPMVSINWKRTVNLALQLRKACYLPPATQYTVRAFSNHNVYAGGKSLEAVSHPYLPVQLVLTNSSNVRRGRSRHTTPRS